MIPTIYAVYNRLAVAFERGEGVHVFDTDGRRYLDFASGLAVSGLGHCHPHLVAALQAQAGKLWHTSNLYRVTGQETLSARLVEATFADTVFFTNSGVEAWECGVKTIRKHFHAKGETARNRIIVVDGAFHGRTLGAISATRSEKMTHGFGPLLPGFDIVPFGEVGAIRAAITPETAAIHVEPIMGDGGIKAWSVDALREMRALADEFGLLLFFDEVQCGMGRTGRLFAHQWAGITPDVMCIAKGIGNGFPLGACLATAHAASGMAAGHHGSTYGGNPLAMAVGNAVLDVMLTPEFLPQVEKTAQVLRTALDGLAKRWPGVIVGIRGVGLLQGVRLQDRYDPTDFVERALADGLLVGRAADNVVRILPPLIISQADIEAAIALLDGVCANLAQAPA